MPLLIKSGAVGVRANSENQNQQRLQILYPFLLIDVVVYKKEKVEKEYLWIGEKDDKKSKYLGFEFPEADLENLVRVKAYGQEFLSPANPETYLEKVYGKNRINKLIEEGLDLNKSYDDIGYTVDVGKKTRTLKEFITELILPD